MDTYETATTNCPGPGAGTGSLVIVQSDAVGSPDGRAASRTCLFTWVTRSVCRSLRRAVDEQQDIRAGLPRLGQFEVGAGAGKQPLARAEHDGVHHQAVLVHQAEFGQRVHQRRAPGDQDVALVPVLEPGHLGRQVGARDDRGVGPGRPGERGRDDVLRHRVHLLGELAAGFLHRRPGGGEPLVGHAPEQLGIGALQLFALELLALGGRVAEAPAAVLGALAAARVIDDPVERDELGDDQLAHGALLFWPARLAGRARGWFLGKPAGAGPVLWCRVVPTGPLWSRTGAAGIDTAGKRRSAPGFQFHTSVIGAALALAPACGSPYMSSTVRRTP